MDTLFICSNGPAEASMRHRVLAFLPRLRAAGHSARLSSFFGDEQGWLRRAVSGVARRGADFARARTVDRVFVHREVFPLANNWLAHLLSSRAELIFDFDDAVFLPTQKGWRRHLSVPESTRVLVERAAVVYAGSEFLVEYARRYTDRVVLMPTVVDTDRFVPAPRRQERVPVVGWVGSPSTDRYLDAVLPALAEVARQTPFRLRIVGAGRTFSVPGVEVECRSWSLDREVSDFQDIDVGIYPLHDDAWARGKCGFKAIQYMACGVPFVVSPVGDVPHIVRDGVDGLHATTVAQWTEALATLLRDEGLRQRLVVQARQTVVSRYSVAALAPTWVRGLERPADLTTPSNRHRP